MSRWSEGELARFVRVYRWTCVIGAIIGIAAAAYFFATGPADLGWVFLILTILLLPAYVLVRWRANRRRR